jgi:hypothetical protein
MNDLSRDDLQALIKEAVAEALRASNLIDGPTHIAHHQALEEMIQAKRHAYRVGITVIISGLIGLLVLGIKSWAEK